MFHAWNLHCFHNYNFSVCEIWDWQYFEYLSASRCILCISSVPSYHSTPKKTFSHAQILDPSYSCLHPVGSWPFSLATTRVSCSSLRNLSCPRSRPCPLVLRQMARVGGPVDAPLHVPNWTCASQAASVLPPPLSTWSPKSGTWETE